MALEDQEQQPSSSSSSTAPLRSPIRSTTTSLLLSSSQRLTTLESPAVLPRWVPNECANECQGCNALFTFLNRRHHCRNCGGLFCSACSTQRAKLSGDHQQPLRVCDGCVSAAHVCGSYHAARSHAARKASMSILSQTAARMSSPRSLDSSCNQQRQGGASAFFGSEPVAAAGAAAESHGGPPSPSAVKSLPLHTITTTAKDSSSKGQQQQDDDLAIAGGGPAPQQQAAVVVTSLHGFAELVSLSLRQVAAIGDAEERQGRILQLLQDLDEIETAKAGLLAAFIASQEEQLLGTTML